MKLNNKRGFTLIEVLVSVSIFTIVMLIATGSVFSIVAANKKTHSLKSVMTNIDFALESMARDMRVGTNYQCGGLGGQDCAAGDVKFAYKANRSLDSDGLKDTIEYSVSGGRLMKQIYMTDSSTQPAFPITATEINITGLKFYVTGAGVVTGIGKQPKVVITIQGNAGVADTNSAFKIETIVTQRALDS